MDQALFILILGTLVFAAHWFAEIFSKKRIPDVLLLMFIGIIIGPLLKLIDSCIIFKEIKMANFRRKFIE